MKRKHLIIVFVCILVIFGLTSCRYNAASDGSCVESREELLKNSSNGTMWHIATEHQIGNHIVSGIYNSNGESGIAVFEPTGDETYKFTWSEWGNSNQVVTSGMLINGTWYDIAWFNGAQTSHAEFLYTSEERGAETLRFQTENMEILSNPAPSNHYTWSVVYYDNDGNTYK